MFKKIFALVFTLALALPFYASAENMDGAYRYAYSLKMGVVDMANVQVFADGLTGYALINSNKLEFKTADFAVKNDGQGNLSGFAYGQALGLVNFNGVKIDASGYFVGSADGGIIVGKMIFDCTNNSECLNGAVAKVKTLWTKNSLVQVPANSVVTPTPIVSTPAPVVTAPVVNASAYFSNKPVAPAPVVLPATTPAVNPTSPSTTSAPVVIEVPKINPVSYKDCDKINDYVAYVNCIADVDAKRTAAKPTTPVVAAEKIVTTVDKPAVKPVNKKVEKPKACKIAKSINTNLTIDVKSKEVENLQSYLACAGFLTDTSYLKGTFDDITEKAVIAWQEANSLKCSDGTACGYMGPSSRKLMNSGKAKIAEVVSETVSEAVESSEVIADVVVEKPVVKAKKVTLKQIKGSLELGAKGDDVKALQAILASDAEIYPEGTISGEFDEATEKAVAKFQENKGLKCNDGTYCGYVGPSTKAKLNLWAKELSK